MRKQVKYSLSTLEVGQEIFIPLEEGDDLKKLRSRVSANASIYSKKSYSKFSTRQTESGIYLVRVL
jgi:hypothetical protein